MMMIDADMSANGRLVVLGTVRLEGRFEGVIVCQRLEVGADGYLVGDVVAEDVELAGQIIGSVTARRVRLFDSAILEGEVVHEALQMEGAATLVGESRRQKVFEMPVEFVQMRVKARATDDELRNLEVESRVRRAGDANRAQAQYAALRARFPIMMASV